MAADPHQDDSKILYPPEWWPEEREEGAEPPPPEDPHLDWPEEGVEQHLAGFMGPDQRPAPPLPLRSVNLILIAIAALFAGLSLSALFPTPTEPPGWPPDPTLNTISLYHGPASHRASTPDHPEPHLFRTTAEFWDAQPLNLESIADAEWALEVLELGYAVEVWCMKEAP